MCLVWLLFNNNVCHCIYYKVELLNKNKYRALLLSNEYLNQNRMFAIMCLVWPHIYIYIYIENRQFDWVWYFLKQNHMTISPNSILSQCYSNKELGSPLKLLNRILFLIFYFANNLVVSTCTTLRIMWQFRTF